MLVDGISDAELAFAFERLRTGGMMDLTMRDGSLVHIEVERIDPRWQYERDWT